MSDTKGVEILTEDLYGCKVTTIHIQSEQAAKGLEKAVGNYITIETAASLDDQLKIEDIGECLVEVLDRVMRPYYHRKLCICGVGSDIPADALGPETAYNLPLKLISESGVEGNFCEVCSIAPGTSFTNNIDTEVIVGGVVKATGADCVLLVDSMVTKDPLRLFHVIEISTAGGVSPHLSGRKADWSNLGIPVISLGIPLAIHLPDLMPDHNSQNILLTSTEVQRVVASAGRIVAYAIIRMCWPSQSKEECFLLSGLNSNPLPYSFLLGRENEKPMYGDSQ